jgi:hypothetical protein
MPLYVRDQGGKDFEKVPQGVHIAVCNMVVDVGQQANKRYGKSQHKVYVRWEIPGKRISWQDQQGGKHEGPMTIGTFYTASLSEKALLRRDLENWRGRAFTDAELQKFDLFNILGVPCQIMVKHNTDGAKVYANVAGVMCLPPGASKPKAENDLIKWSPDDGAQWEQLPEWLRKRIEESRPQQSSGQANGYGSGDPDPEFSDDIPF